MHSVSFFVKFFGRVQGVGFRMLVVSKANELGVFGWVRNSMQRDLVEAVFVGEEAKVDSLISGLKSNTGFVRVDNVVVEVININEKFNSFSIKY